MRYSRTKARSFAHTLHARAAFARRASDAPSSYSFQVRMIYELTAAAASRTEVQHCARAETKRVHNSEAVRMCETRSRLTRTSIEQHRYAAERSAPPPTPCS